MTAISLKNISKNYDEVSVIKDLNLEIGANEFVVLVGPSGCGKSTTLRMIAGLEDISCGKLFFGDKDMTHAAPKDRGISMVFQNYALYPHMDVYENIAFGLRLAKIPDQEIKVRVDRIAETLGLTDYLKRKPKALSGGQRQRVAMGRAMAKNANIFLFDEPLSNLDAKLRAQMRTEIKQRHQENKKTTVYVTHDQIEAMGLADKIVIMRGGVIEQIGTPMEVYKNPANKFVASFIGSPGMNFFDLKVEKSGTKKILTDKHKALSLTLPEDKERLLGNLTEVTLGIRPSDIFISTSSDNLKNEWKKQAKIEVVEPLGKNAFIQFKIGELRFTGETMGHHLPFAGENVLVSFNMEHANLFNAKDETSLTKNTNII